MSKFYKWLKDNDQKIYWYLVGTGIDKDSGSCVLGWVFGEEKGEGPLVMDPEVKKSKIEIPENYQKYEKRMISDAFETKLWYEDYWNLKSVRIAD